MDARGDLGYESSSESSSSTDHHEYEGWGKSTVETSATTTALVQTRLGIPTELYSSETDSLGLSLPATRVRGAVTNEPDGSQVVLTTSLSTFFSTATTTSGTEAISTTIPVLTSTAIIQTTIRRGSPSSSPLGSSSVRAPIAVGPIVGIVLGVGMVLVATISLIIVLFRRRKALSFLKGTLYKETKLHLTPFTGRKAELYPEKFSAQHTLPPVLPAPISPGPSPTQHSHFSIISSTRTHRQQWLQSRIHQLITDLEEALTAANEGTPDGNVDLGAEIDRLGQLLQSDWALGLTDEPPPSYRHSDIIGENV